MNVIIKYLEKLSFFFWDTDNCIYTDTHQNNIKIYILKSKYVTF